MTGCLLILILSTLVSGLRGEDVMAGIRAAVLLVQSYVLILYLFNLDLDERLVRWLTIGMCLALAFQGLIGSLQGITKSSLGLDFLGATEAAYMDRDDMNRVGGTLGWSNRFATFVNTLILVPIAWTLSRRFLLERVAGTSIFLLALFVLFLSKSRGSWGALCLCLPVFLYFGLAGRMTRFHRLFFLSVGGIFGILALLAIPGTRDRLLGDDEGSAHARIPMSLTAIAMIQEHPLGVGLGNYVSIMHRFDQSEDRHTIRFRHPVHNAYLLLCAEQGIPGSTRLLCLPVSVPAHLPRPGEGAERSREGGSPTLRFGRDAGDGDEPDLLADHRRLPDGSPAELVPVRAGHAIGRFGQRRRRANRPLSRSKKPRS